jgi:hypothetical protein
VRGECEFVGEGPFGVEGLADDESRARCLEVGDVADQGRVGVGEGQAEARLSGHTFVLGTGPGLGAAA